MVKCNKDARVYQNVTFRVLDADTHECVQEVVGHNQATNTLLEGMGYYLAGNGVLNQGYAMLSDYIPRYISLGTMGLISQDADASGLPSGLNPVEYMAELPGFGADGYDSTLNNDRPYFGLGPAFADRADTGTTVDCELVSSSFPRVAIQQRRVLPEVEAEIEQTVDVVFTAMISTGALAQFRVPGTDYIFITEAGLWSQRESQNLGDGLLAGYRIVPSNADNWDMTVPGNVDILKRTILRVGVNQVVQVIWKIQLGSLTQLANASSTPTSARTTVTLDRHYLYMEKGVSTTFTATVTAADPGAQIGVTWSSSNPAVATVDSSGTVSGICLGDTTITATANDGSGASDSAAVLITGENVSQPLGAVMNTDLCIAGPAYIGAGVQIACSDSHVRNGVFWEESTTPAGEWSNTSGELYIQTGLNGEAIHTGGNNNFYPTIYRPDNLTITSDDPSEEASPSTFIHTGTEVLPVDYTFPNMQPLQYAGGGTIIPGMLGATVIIKENEILVITAEDVLHTGRAISITLPDAAQTVVTGYVQYHVSSADYTFGRYGQLTLESSAASPVTCYIYQGSYVFTGINIIGDYCTFKFLEATVYYKTIFAINSSFTLPQNSAIEGIAMSVILYTGGNAQVSTINDVYLFAPNGEVVVVATASQINPRIYAKQLSCAAGVDLNPF